MKELTVERVEELRTFLEWEISQTTQQLDGAVRVGHESAKNYADNLGKLKDLLALLEDCGQIQKRFDEFSRGVQQFIHDLDNRQRGT